MISPFPDLGLLCAALRLLDRMERPGLCNSQSSRPFCEFRSACSVPAPVDCFPGGRPRISDKLHQLSGRHTSHHWHSVTRTQLNAVGACRPAQTSAVQHDLPFMKQQGALYVTTSLAKLHECLPWQHLPGQLC